MMNGSKYRDYLNENQDLKQTQRFTFQQDQDSKHTARLYPHVIGQIARGTFQLSTEQRV